MNCNVTGTNSELRTFNKSRRKRKRSKHKGNSTKKSQKTASSSSKQNNFVSSVQKNFFSNRRKNKDALLIHLKNQRIMSTWYWANYNKALAWRSKHKVAHWKAYALALQHENNYLLEIIKGLDPGQKLNIPRPKQDLEELNVQEKVNIAEFEDIAVPSTSGTASNACGDDEVQIEMSEEMMKFFEQSFKHKMDLKRVREEAEKKTDGEKFIKESQKARLQREDEMKSLYGDEVSMIVGMETAVQLSYERYCDTKSPKYWPNIPLRL